MADQPTPVLPPELPELVLYWDIGFQGEQRVFNGATPYVGDHWNDQASSVVVVRGNWQLFEDADYKGKATPVLGPGRYGLIDHLGIGNDRLSSLKPV